MLEMTPVQQAQRNLAGRTVKSAIADDAAAVHSRVIAVRAIIQPVKTSHRKTLAAIFAKPTRASVAFSDIEALVKALGGSVTEREGSRVKIELAGQQWRCHRPHPGKEVKRYQFEEAHGFPERAGVKP